MDLSAILNEIDDEVVDPLMTLEDILAERDQDAEKQPASAPDQGSNLPDEQQIIDLNNEVNDVPGSDPTSVTEDKHQPQAILPDAQPLGIILEETVNENNNKNNIFY
jgi:hypothetical protein